MLKKEGKKMTEKNLKILGWLGTLLSVIMYVSYVPQIMGNLHGHKTFFLQPLAATVNLPGVIFGFLATVTAF